MRGRALALRSLLAAVSVLAPALIAVPVHADNDDSEYRTVGGPCGRGTFVCTDVAYSEHLLGYYTGHDEPAVLFYSNTPGSGNDMVYRVQLPRDPPIPPNEAGTGGTWNFQLRPAFWFGMAMCDTTSAPLYTDQCTPDSDANIFDDPNPASPHYVGKHPGTAFTELQFYPPGWVEWPAAVKNAGGSSCDPTRWCAALNVDSLLLDMNNGVFNNPDCEARAGDETVNFAFLTRDGRSLAPADPLVTFANPGSPGTVPDRSRVAFFDSGDTLEVHLHDTPDGLETTVRDLDTRATGSMTASISNGFAHLLFQPNAKTCTSVPYAFHPMYSTSSEQTRVVWAAHTYNVAYSDEIGHFEYCPNVKNASILAGTGVCASASATDPAGKDSDDNYCFTADMSSRIRISGCTDSDLDFDGPEYGKNWPGSTPNFLTEFLLHTTPLRFTSPLIRGETNYDRVAYEADLPAIEPTCDVFTGAGCTNPPPGAAFYPFFTTGYAFNDLRGFDDDRAAQWRAGESCVWREGGAFLPGTRPGNYTNAADEFGPAPFLVYPVQGGPISIIEDYRRILNTNPCPTQEGSSRYDTRD